MSSLTNALQELREERKKAQLHVAKLDQAISVIKSLNGVGASGNGNHPGRVISAASRRKMAIAQQARWAKARNGAQPVATDKVASAPAKRTMSASARRKIAAAQKARWAKVRAGKKSAA